MLINKPERAKFALGEIYKEEYVDEEFEILKADIKA